MAQDTSTLDAVISLAKRRGFVFPSGEIYGGTRSAWDYGPLGVELKENIKRQWWKTVVRMREDVVGIDSSVILPTAVWNASGHVEAFTDPLIECQSCHHRFRQDQLVEQFAEKKGVDEDEVAMTEIACPDCGVRGQWTEPRAFSGLLKTFLDRCNPLYPSDYKFRDVYFLATAAESEDSAMEGPVKAVQGWVDCFEKARLAGTVFRGGVDAPGEIKGHEALEKAREMGGQV